MTFAPLSAVAATTFLMSNFQLLNISMKQSAILSQCDQQTRQQCQDFSIVSVSNGTSFLAGK